MGSRVFCGARLTSGFVSALVALSLTGFARADQTDPLPASGTQSPSSGALAPLRPSTPTSAPSESQSSAVLPGVPVETRSPAPGRSKASTNDRGSDGIERNIGVTTPWNEQPDPGSFYLQMNKSLNELSVRSFDQPGKVFKTYRAITGTNSGDKEREGDKKTPEGIYFVEARVPKTRMTSLHGAAAFELNYPNVVDRIYKRSGGGIWIHGVDNENRMEKRFDTLGCVAVSNGDIVDLAEHLRMKNTPIVIFNHEDSSVAIGVEAPDGPLHKRVTEWAQVWSSRDVDAYLKFYSPDFYARKMNLDQWSKYKKRLAKTYTSIDVTIRDLKILKHGKYSVAVFEQTYKSNLYHRRSLKRLYLVGDGADAQILAEEVAQEAAGIEEPLATTQL